MESSTFDSIVSGLFRAASGAISWDTALVPIGQAFGARAAVLHWMQPSTGRLLALPYAGPELESTILDYVREYHRIDPRRQHVIERGVEGVGQWNHDHEIFGPGFVARNPYYRHFLPAAGTRHHANVAFAIDNDLICGLALELDRGRGPLDGDEREAARRLGLHLQEALHAWERVRRIANQALAGHALLRAFAYPMWLIDGDRFIAFENDAARGERERDDRIVADGHRLILRAGRTDLALTQQLAKWQAGSAAATAVIDLRPTRADPPQWLHLSRVVPQAVLGAFGQRALVLATLFDPGRIAPLDPYALAQMFALTPTEARVAARLGEGHTLEAIASLHGIGLTTVRTHVRHLLAKFGVDRRSEIVRLLRQGEALWSGRASGAG